MLIRNKFNGFMHDGTRRAHISSGGSSGGPQQTTSYTTNLPEYAQPYVMNMLGAAQNQLFTTQGDQITGFRPYTPYSTDPTQYFAGPSSLQQGVYNEAGQMQTPGQYNVATGMAGMAGLGQLGAGQQYAQQATSPGAVGAYMSPYQQNVTDIAKMNAVREAQIAGQQANLGAARQGTYGGARQALAGAEREKNLLANLSNIQAQGSQAAYDKAVQNMQYGANLGLQGLAGAGQAASTLGGLGTAQQQADLARMGFQQQTGQQQQAYQQNIINQAIQDYATAQQYPMMQLSAMSSLLRGLPLQSATTQTYQAAPSVTSQLAGLGTAGIGAYGLGKATGVFKEGGQVQGYKYGGAISDEKLKAMANSLTVDQLQAQLRDPTLTTDERQIFASALQDKSRGAGLAGLNTNLGEFAGGGIVAFAGEDGSLVDEEDDDSTDVSYTGEADDDDLIDTLIASRIPAGAYGGRGLGAVGINPAAPSGSGIRAEARAPSGLSTSDVISSAATKYNLPPDLMQRIAASESGGKSDAANKLSSAKGLFQFTDATWKGMGGKEGQQFDAAMNADLGGKFIRQNAEGLKSALNRNPTYAETYAAHYFGLGGAKKLLSADADTPMSQLFSADIIKANPNLKGKTAGEVMADLKKKTGAGVVELAHGGAIRFQDKGAVKDKEEEDSDYSDYLSLGLFAPDAIRLLRGAPSLPPGSLPAAGTAAARTLGSIGAAATTAGVPSTIGYGGYKLAKGAAKTLARPEAKEFRKALVENPALSAAAGPDTSLAASILEMQSPEWKERNKLEADTLKNAPWYTRMYGVGRSKYLDENMLREPGVVPGAFGPPRSAMLSPDDTKKIDASNAAAQAVIDADADEAVSRLASQGRGGQGMGGDNASKLEQMLLRREQALEKQGAIDASLATILGGLAAAGGKSSNALENIAGGAQTGLGYYAGTAKQRAAGENAILSGRLGIEKLRGLQDYRQAQMEANKEAKLGSLVANREKQLENFAYNTVRNLGIVIDSEEGQKALANKLAELRANDDILAKLYRDYGLPPIKVAGPSQNALVLSAEERLKQRKY